MKILALDTSTQACSVSLLLDSGDILSEHKVLQNRHGDLLLPMINSVTADAEFSLSQLDCVAFTKGPGSFTGLRIGAGVVQGIAYAFDLPIVSASSLAVLAQGAVRQFSAVNILPAIDARMKQVYLGVYCVGENNLVVAQQSDSLCDPDKLKVEVCKNSWVAVGSGWDNYSDVISSNFDKKLIDVQPGIYPSSVDLIGLAKSKYTNGAVCAADEVQLCYLRDDVVSK